ncbi:MAG: carboxypeptidase regulatory-like domain-containing protein [Sedimentisphaerales bacterium]|nr:carboxypeptidase regulatory-like domain-containing protein [Sedimentisphaerales bacterium]
MMRQCWMVVLCIGVAIIHMSAAEIRSTESKQRQITCTGKVLDEQDDPIADVKVKLYRVEIELGSLSYNLKCTQEVTTDTEGHFELTSAIGDSIYSEQAIILADKEGLALGWANWRLRENTNVEIALGPPKVLAGIVVDEHGKPISDADVGISFMWIQTDGQPQYIVGNMSLELLTTRSDAEGKFTVDRIPDKASAEFVVKKPGRATISTFDPQNFQGGSLQYSSGRTDIQITQPAGAKIEGIVVEKASGKPIGGIRLMAIRDQNRPNFGMDPVVSKEDGTFCIDGLAPGQHLLQMASLPYQEADWISEPVDVVTEAGKTKSGVKVELMKGGLLEVLLTDSISKQSIDQATVSVQPSGGDTGSAGQTDKAGIARIRLLPGDYRIVYINKQGYSRVRLEEEIITVEDGKTVRVEHQLSGMPKITGRVSDNQGRPVEGVTMKVCPMSGQDTVSDAEGNFEVSWDPGSWHSPDLPAMIFLARHKERNLAAALEIDENTRTVDITLKPGVVIAGKVMDPDGKGIANAKLLIMIRGPRWGSSIEHNLMTDAEGNYEIKALAPESKFSIEASANGFGRYQIQAETDQAVNQQLNVEPITLSVANLSVTGVVVDSDEKPVSGADVSCYGDNQPRNHTRTDAKGQFTLENVCEGKIQISANKNDSSSHIYGSIETEGGATDVRIAIGQRGSSTSFQPKRPPSLIGKPLPDIKALGIPGDIEGKRVLVCFWDMEQRPSRHYVTQLAKLNARLKEKDVIIVAVQASKMDQNKLDEWVKKYKIPFPVGMIRSDEKKTQFAWGVRSLPWLILTDHTHKIRCTNFRLNELDEKIKEMSDEKR